MNRITIITYVGLAAAVLLGWYLRSPELDARPMHADEAILAVKFADFQQTGIFEYDPRDYHGPGIHYATLPIAALAGESNLLELSETTLRLGPVIFGLTLIVFLFPLRKTAGAGGVIWAGLLTAISPIFVYYNRYFIMESHFVLFTTGFIICGWRYLTAETPKFGWILAAGVFAGLMHATKETCAVSFLAIFGALGVCSLIRRKCSVPLVWRDLRDHWKPLAICIGTAVVVSALLYSNFFRNPRAVADSYLTYFSYADRAGGVGHEDVWSYYLTMLYEPELRGKSEQLFTAANFNLDYAAILKPRPAFIIGETVIGVMGLAGALFSFTPVLGRRRAGQFGRFVTFYAAITMAIYSMIPYKTPWTIMSFHHAIILLAGLGLATLFALIWKIRPRVLRVGALCIPAAVILFFLFHLYAYTRWANLKYYWQINNRFVYSHSTPRIFNMDKLAHAVAAIHPDGKNMPIVVVSEEAWPLPWYLRDLPHSEYRLKPDAGDPSAPLLFLDSEIAVDLVIKRQEETGRDVREEYNLVGPWSLRTYYGMSVWVRKDLWERIDKRTISARRR